MSVVNSLHGSPRTMMSVMWYEVPVVVEKLDGLVKEQAKVEAFA